MNKKLSLVLLLIPLITPTYKTQAYCAGCGMSSGAVAGATIGGVAAAALIIGLAVHAHHKREQKQTGNKKPKKELKKQPAKTPEQRIALADSEE